MPGSYVKKSYLANDYVTQYGIIVQPETLTLTLTGRANQDSGGQYSGHQVIVTKASVRSRRHRARTVSFRFKSVLPDGYKAGTVLRLPWLRPEGFDQLVPGSEGEYQGLPIVVVAKFAERIAVTV